LLRLSCRSTIREPRHASAGAGSTRKEYDVPNRNQNQGSQENAGQGRGRGFAGMDAEQQRRIASAGGRAAHASGHAHEFTSEEAREAGRKGGEVRSQRGRASGTAATVDRDLQGTGNSGGGTDGQGAPR
jgi:hypothetical protein